MNFPLVAGEGNSELRFFEIRCIICLSLLRRRTVAAQNFAASRTWLEENIFFLPHLRRCIWRIWRVHRRIIHYHSPCIWLMLDWRVNKCNVGNSDVISQISHLWASEGGIQAYDYEPPKERYPIDFLRAGYFLFLHVVAFTCALAWLRMPLFGSDGRLMSQLMATQLFLMVGGVVWT